MPEAITTEVFNKYKEDISKIVGSDVTLSKQYNSFLKGYGGDFTLRGPDRRVVAYWSLSEMYGCCGICVSFHSVVMNDFRGKGIGTILNSLRKDLAAAYGYGLLMCTDVESNVPQQKILERNGWAKIDSFVNPRTGNPIAVHTIKLK